MITTQRFSSFWFWYLILTLAYLLLGTFAFEGPATLLSHLVGLLGLFVPFGFMSLFLLATPLGLIAVPLFFISGYFFSKWLNKQNYSLGKRIIMIFLALLILTTLVDMVRQTPFASWQIFIDGKLDIIS